MPPNIGGGAGNGNGGDGPKVSRTHAEPHPAAKSERTVTWPVKDGDALIGTVRLSNGVYECVLPDGTVIETFKSLNFAVEFLHQRGQAIPPEQQAVRLKADVDELSRKSATDRLYWLSDYAKRHGIAEAKLEQMIEAEIAANEKNALEQQQAERRREQREKEKARQEKATTREKRQDDERQERKARRDARDQQAAERRARQEEERARKEAERLEREQRKREAAFAEIAELPRLTHQTRLKEAAAKLGEDLNVLTEEFEVFYATRTIPKNLEPWPEPVDVAELLGAIEKKFRRYVVASDAIVTASALWVAFTYVVEIATHAPKLVAGASTALHVTRWMSQRAYAATEASGPAIYRIIDRLRPTLFLDEADTLFKRSNLVAHVVNESWINSGSKIPRAARSKSDEKSYVEYDVYGTQAIAIKGLHNMPDATQSRCIICTIWPKLASEAVEDFTFQDDDEFKSIRRKLLRWSVDNAVVLRDAKPQFPPGFNNRIRTNWKMLLAIAELAGDKWPEQVRKAALKLETDRDEPSEDIRLFAALRDIWGDAKERTSESLCKALAKHLSGEWADITRHKLAAKLKPYGIRPIHGLHPTGRSNLTRGGYRYTQFENAFARLLQKPSPDPHTRTPGGGRRRKRR
jgi:hypothetical protein